MNVRAFLEIIYYGLNGSRNGRKGDVIGQISHDIFGSGYIVENGRPMAFEGR